MEKRHVYDGDIRMKLMISRFVGRGFCPILSDYDTLGIENNVSETRNHLLHEQRLYAALGFGAEKKIMSSFCADQGRN